jgi:hypothetical protein
MPGRSDNVSDCSIVNDLCKAAYKNNHRLVATATWLTIYHTCYAKLLTPSVPTTRKSIAAIYANSNYHTTVSPASHQTLPIIMLNCWSVKLKTPARMPFYAKFKKRTRRRTSVSSLLTITASAFHPIQKKFKLVDC